MNAFIDKRLFVSKIQNIGYGVFAGKYIPKNTIIEVSLTKHVYDHQICEDLNLINDYTYYFDKKKCVLSLGFGSIYNHADYGINNVSYVIKKNKIIYKTIKNIQKNQQLTVDYGDEWIKNRNIKISNEILFSKKNKRLEVFIDKKLYVKNNKIYTKKEIKKNDIVEISHIINFDNIFYLNKNHSLSKLFFYNKKDNFVIPLGYGNIYRIKNKSNLSYNIKNKKVYFIAKKKINKNEELVVSKQNLFYLK